MKSKGLTYSCIMQHKMHVNWITPLENLLPLICLSRAGWPPCTAQKGRVCSAQPVGRWKEQGHGQGGAAVPRQDSAVSPSLSLCTLSSAARAGKPTSPDPLLPSWSNTSVPAALQPFSVIPLQETSSCLHAFTSAFFPFQE